jgi:integrase
MKGSVHRSRKTWRYQFETDPDPLTGDRKRGGKSGFKTKKEAEAALTRALADHQDGSHAHPSRRTVAELIAEWLERRKHKIKPSMNRNYRNYASYYINPYIGSRIAQDLDSAVFDALYDKLLTEGRVKARPKARVQSEELPVHTRRLNAAGKVLECCPKRDQPVRCWKKHSIDDPALGTPILPKSYPIPASLAAPPPGLAPKTVVNVHRMLHRVWEDGSRWRYVKRNVVSDASPPRVPRTSRTTWTVEQLGRFLFTARDDRFFALWVLEATTGLRRSELAGAPTDGLDFEEAILWVGDTRVVVDGAVLDSDGKSAESRRPIALDAVTLELLRAHVAMLESERAEYGPAYHDQGRLFCWPDGRSPHPDTITARFNRLVDKAGLPRIRLHDVRHSYATAGRKAKADPKALSQRLGHSTVAFTMTAYQHDDLEAQREVADLLAKSILGGLNDQEPDQNVA